MVIHLSGYDLRNLDGLASLKVGKGGQSNRKEAGCF